MSAKRICPGCRRSKLQFVAPRSKLLRPVCNACDTANRARPKPGCEAAYYAELTATIEAGNRLAEQLRVDLRAKGYSV